ncbi:Hypothetical predicted protein [Mytilus galloprovincialis]|uniref:Uncharacterized protein n=1 Tax=Mytilus galloprovincialis TaxID=29158 RepID=A0A8B6C6E5_MYTGA|nr:Hypothetical predicted protein [Mytilus galloprovincialis]
MNQHTYIYTSSRGKVLEGKVRCKTLRVVPGGKLETLCKYAYDDLKDIDGLKIVYFIAGIPDICSLERNRRSNYEESFLKRTDNGCVVSCIETKEYYIRQELVNNNQVDTNAAPILPQAANNSVTSVISELNERKSRKNNLIIYGTKECNSENVEERKDFDLELLTDIAQNCEVDLNTYNIGKLRRIGKFDKDKAHRPLLFQSETPVLRNTSKLKGTDKKYNTLSLSHDMTKSEREEEKKLFAEAKEKEKKSQGKFTFKVRRVLDE